MPATRIRSSRSTAATCSRCCSTPSRERIGPERVVAGLDAASRVEQDGDGGVASISAIPPASRCRRAARAVAIACDGIHSVDPQAVLSRTKARRAIRASTCGAASTRWQPFLSGASMVRAGWLATGKMVIYPIRDAVDADGRQLVNWVAEIETPHHRRRDWNRARQARRFHRRLRRLAFRLARRAGVHSRRRHGARISDGRPGPAAALELRPRHAARRRRPPDGAARLERRRPGDPRRARARRLPCARRTIRRRRSRPTRTSRRAATARIVLTNRTQAAGRDPARGLPSAPATGRSRASRTSSAATSWRRCPRATSRSRATTGRG